MSAQAADIQVKKSDNLKVWSSQLKDWRDVLKQCYINKITRLKIGQVKSSRIISME